MKNYTQMFRSEQKRNLKTIIVALLFLIPQHKSFAQASGYMVDGYGRTLNISAGAEYYTFVGKQVPFVFIDHEFGVGRNFTLAPSVGIGTFQSKANHGYENIGYYYRATLAPIGLKARYYLDRLLGLNANLDLYIGASAAYVVTRIDWQYGYGGNKNVSIVPIDQYVNAHIGAQYHISRKVGLFADLSTSVSTVGLAFHNF